MKGSQLVFVVPAVDNGETLPRLNDHAGPLTHAKSCKLGTTFAFFIRLSSNFAGW